MMSLVQTVKAARPLGRAVLLVVVLGGAGLAGSAWAQQTGPQELAFAGLRAVASQGVPEGQINAIQTDAKGDLYLLIDQKDGVRVLKTDAAAANILAQAQIGAKGDVGLGMALDPAGNVYVTGTTTSGALTATAGAAFLTASGTSTNSFVAKFDANLNTYFVTFAGGGFMSATGIAATADAVFITGGIYSASLPVTAAGIIQAPAFGSSGNGFVEKFSASGGTLLYATYLSGAGGNTTPSAIAADASDDAYIVGTTTAPGYPTIAAVVPAILGTTSGFLTKLTPAGDGITFSTFIPGAGITSLALDAAAGNLLLAGPVSLGQFPVTNVQTPLIAGTYQVLVRMPLDGSSVIAATVVAPGTQSFVAAGAAGTAWVAGSLSLPVLPLAPLASFGNSFAARVNAANVVDQTARFGGLAAANPGSASAPVNLTSLAVDASGDVIAGGSFAPSASAALLASETFDLPLADAPTAALPSGVRAAVLPAAACQGSLCSGSAAYLAKVTVPASLAAATASLALAVDDSPNLTLRNLGSAQAMGLQVSVTGFTDATNCGTTLAAGAECSIGLSGTGPGSITVTASNASTQTQALPALATGATALPVVFSPKELDFGVVSAAGGAATQTVTVTNLTQQAQTFVSALDASARATFPYTIAEKSSDCTTSGAANTKLLAAGAACHITLALTASSNAANDGAIHADWLISSRDVQLTGYEQAEALSLSAAEVDFGTQYTGGLRLPRYLYLSNHSTAAVAHAAVTLPASSAFTVSDRCPALLEPASVCQLQLGYQNSHTPSADAVTLELDEGLTALVTGRSLPQPGVNGASANPNLSVSATALNFATPVVVTGVSSATETLTIQNTGASAFALSLVLTGDFTDATNCGASLAGGASCSVVFSFAPSAPGTREGLVAVTAGAGTTPVYVTLTGVGTGILSPAGNGTIDFGSVLTGEPVVQWYKVTQPFTSFGATTATGNSGAPFTVVLVEDIGYGHGEPAASEFSTSDSGTCLNCWVGVRFTPTATGVQTSALSLTSATSGNAYVLSLTGSGLPLTGLVLSPYAQDFGPVPVNSMSGAEIFTLTNLAAGQSSVTLSSPAASGDFTLSNAPTGGAACGGALAYTASCFVVVAFTPTATGPRAGTLMLQVGSSSVSAALTGYGSPDPGLALSPTALTFSNVPGAGSTLQTVTLTNTGTAALQIGTPAIDSASFSETTNCATLNTGGTCTISVSFSASTAPVAGTLSIPVTATVGGTPVVSTYAVPLTGAYTTENAGIAMVPAAMEFGPQTTGTVGVARQFTVTNLTAKSLTLEIALPRQFVLAGPPCSGLAPLASCNFSVAFLPLANGDITGTLFAQATPTDGSATLNGLAYVEGYGNGGGALSVTGGLQPGELLSFGQVPSGQAVSKTLTLTNTSSASPAAPLTIRRITSEWPFLATSTCGATLAPAQLCTVTLSYTPLNQVATGTVSPSNLTDIGTLVIESDAASSPDLIDLTGTSTPAQVSTPSNTAPLVAFTPSPSSLTFATTGAGNVSTPQTVTLANTGSATLHILGLQTTPDFTVASNCGAIVPGASCTLTVSFTPQASSQAGTGSGLVASAIEIASDASTPLEFISLAGTSSPSTLTLNPTSLSFGTVPVGATGMLPLTITNTATSPATFVTVIASGDYTVANGSCPSTGLALAGGASCKLQVTFAPAASGVRTGTLTIGTSASTAGLLVPLSGTGAQAHLQITPESLGFGSVGVGASASLSLTLANTGTTAITGIALAASGDYSVAIPCAVTTLAAGASCSVTVAFTPTAAGTRTGVVTVTSSDASSPASVPLSGTGSLIGTFSLTVATGSATVQSGSAATYNLTVTPGNGFTGTIALTCMGVTPATYAACSLAPSTVTLSGLAQNATATLNTVVSVAADTGPARPGRGMGETLLGLLLPGLIFAWKARTSRHRAWRRVGPVAWAVVSAIALLSSNGCGGGGTALNPNLRYATAGTYQYQVSASSTGAAAPVTQTVTLTLIVQ